MAKSKRAYDHKQEQALKYEMYRQKYFDDLFNKAISMYEWIGLPKEIDYRFIERLLMGRGMAVFFRSEDLNEYVVTRVTYNGKLDIYDNYDDRRAYAVNGFNAELTNQNSVLIFNNFLRYGIVKDLEIYAEELANIKMTMDVNREQQKIPKIIKTQEEQVLSFKNLMQSVKGFAHYIIGSKNLDINEISVLDVQAPYLLDKLQEDFNERWSEALTFLGIESGESKTERMLQGEILASQGDVEAQRYVYLNARRQACEMINEMFNLNVQVNFRSNTTTMNTQTTTAFNESKIEDLNDGGMLYE